MQKCNYAPPSFFVHIAIILLACLSSLDAQESVSDVLLDKTYDELKAIYVPMDKDSLSAIPYIRAFMIKAKAEDDTLKMARAYMDLGWISKSNVKFQYADSILQLTKDIVDKTFPAYAYETKADYYYLNYENEDALDNYLKAYNSALKSGNIKRQTINKFNIAAIRSRIGDYKEAIATYREVLWDLGDQTKSSFGPNDRYLIYFNLYNNHREYGALDSAQFYLNKGLNKELMSLDSTLYFQFDSNRGILSYFQGDYLKAEEILTETLLNRNERQRIISFYYRAKSNLQLGNNFLAYKDLKKIDSMTTDKSYYIPELLDVYKILSNNYKAHKDYANEVKYINKYLIFDSILNTKYNNLNKKLFTSFDTPELIRNKDRRESLLYQLEGAKDTFQNYVYLFTVVFTLFATTLYLYVRKQRKQKKHFLKLIEESNIKQLKKRTEKIGKINEIPESVLIKIRKKLTQFETENRFLSNNISLINLSKEIKTNSSYLSKVINIDRGKNFSTYINDLRITYVVKKLTKDSKFRKYTIKAIAEHIGFNNSESFSKAFRKETNLYPSYFIKNVEKHETMSRNS